MDSPGFEDWYTTLLCPWDLDQCGDEWLGKNGDENLGVPIAWSGDRQNAKYVGEPDRRSMSCGLCGWLKRQLGLPPFLLPTDPGVLDDVEHGKNWYFSK